MHNSQAVALIQQMLATVRFRVLVDAPAAAVAVVVADLCGARAQEGITSHTGHAAAAEQLVGLEGKMASMLEAAAAYAEGLRLAREKFVQIGILDKVRAAPRRCPDSAGW